MTHPARGLGVFNDPEAVSVVGASDHPAKWGYWLARGALRGSHRRPVHLVNRRGGSVAGRPSVTSLAEIDGPLGLVALCVPAAQLADVVPLALDLGATGFLAITAGLDREAGRSDAELEMATEIRRRGARLVGPNCLGIYDASTELELAWGEFEPGQLAIVSQSGQVGSELANLASECGLGVSRFVSIGNQVDVTAAELLADLIGHDATAVVGLYVESFRDGRAIIDVLRLLRAAGKPTLLLTVGSSAASRHAAASHTGSLTSATELVDAACRAAGAVRVQTPAQLVEAALVVATAPAPRGPRVAVVGDSGGQAALAADVLTHAGLRVPRFTDRQRHALATLLPTDAAASNPVDLAGTGESDLETYAAVVEAQLADDDIDAVVLTGYFGTYGRHSPTLQEAESAVARRLALASSEQDKPLVVHSMCADSLTVDVLRSRGVPVRHTIEDAALGLAAATSLVTRPGRDLRLPAATPSAVPSEGYLAARRVLEAVGARFPPAMAVTSLRGLREAVGLLHAPFVLKADWIAHKTEAGAVVVGLADAAAAEPAFGEMSGRLGAGTYVVEELDARADVVEMIVGARRDPVFGPVVMVGTGGVHAELLADTSVELAPVDRETAEDMVRRLRGYPVLTGWRGRPAVDVEALLALVVTVSRVLVAAPERCTDIELNPVRVGPDGALCVDALIHVEPSTQPAILTTQEKSR